MDEPIDTFTLDGLCALANLPKRTVRFYIQQGLVDRPHGETRNARYGKRHLDQLLTIHKWTQAGLTLARIKEILQGEPPQVPVNPPKPGTVRVKSHLLVTEGVEILVDPHVSMLTPEQQREFFQGVMAVWQQLQAKGNPTP